MPLFRTLDRRRNLTETRLLRQDAWRVIKRRCSEAGLGDIFSNHTLRASGITAYMLAGGTLEKLSKWRLMRRVGRRICTTAHEMQ